jgi:hypothetical protein
MVIAVFSIPQAVLPGIVGRMFIRPYTWHWGGDGGEDCLNQDFQDFRIMGDDGLEMWGGYIFCTGLFLCTSHDIRRGAQKTVPPKKGLNAVHF